MEKLFAIVNIDNYLVSCVQSYSADDLAVVFPKEQYTAIEYTIENAPTGNFWDGTQFIQKDVSSIVSVLSDEIIGA